MHETPTSVSSRPEHPGTQEPGCLQPREAGSLSSFLPCHAPPKCWGFPLRFLSCPPPHDPHHISALRLIISRSSSKEDGEGGIGSKPHPRRSRDEPTQAWRQGSTGGSSCEWTSASCLRRRREWRPQRGPFRCSAWERGSEPEAASVSAGSSVSRTSLAVTLRDVPTGATLGERRGRMTISHSAMGQLGLSELKDAGWSLRDGRSVVSWGRSPSASAPCPRRDPNTGPERGLLTLLKSWDVAALSHLRAGLGRHLSASMASQDNPSAKATRFGGSFCGVLQCHTDFVPFCLSNWNQSCMRGKATSVFCHW